MTTSQTIDGVLVSRELLELAYLELVDTFSWASELRALLDVPEKLPLIDTHNERLIASLRKRVNELEAAQPQGEPVAWVVFDNGFIDDHTVVKTVADEWADRGIEVTPLYAEQSAPVSVVPERLSQVLKFLEGAENLDGYWFGEPGPHGSKVWWRAELRKALEETNLFAKPE